MNIKNIIKLAVSGEPTIATGRKALSYIKPLMSGKSVIDRPAYSVKFPARSASVFGTSVNGTVRTPPTGFKKIAMVGVGPGLRLASGTVSSLSHPMGIIDAGKKFVMNAVNPGLKARAQNVIQRATSRIDAGTRGWLRPSIDVLHGAPRPTSKIIPQRIVPGRAAVVPSTGTVSAAHGNVQSFIPAVQHISKQKMPTVGTNDFRNIRREQIKQAAFIDELKKIMNRL